MGSKPSNVSAFSGLEIGVSGIYAVQQASLSSSAGILCGVECSSTADSTTQALFSFSRSSADNCVIEHKNS